MIFTTELNHQVYSDFIKEHPLVHYQKTLEWGDFRIQHENVERVIAGVIDNNKVLATAQIFFKKMTFFHGLGSYVALGPCVDFSDNEVLDCLLDGLKDLAFSKGSTFLRLDPNVELVHRKIDGSQVEDGYNNHFVTEKLISKGYAHLGYGYAYNGAWSNRYTLAIDLSSDLNTIRSRYGNAKQKTLKRQVNVGITSRIGKRNELFYLSRFEKELAHEKKFKPKSTRYFEQLIDCMGEKSEFAVCEINFETAIDYLNEELSSSKYAKDTEARTKKVSELNQYQEWLRDFGKIVVIGAGFFVYCGAKSWNLYMYKRETFSSLKGLDNLHDFMIERMKNKGVVFYDMVGFSGSTNPQDPYYGLYTYKKSFSPRFVEYLGEFTYIIRPKSYLILRKIERYTKSLKRCLYKYWY